MKRCKLWGEVNKWKGINCAREEDREERRGEMAVFMSFHWYVEQKEDDMNGCAYECEPYVSTHHSHNQHCLPACLPACLPGYKIQD